MPLRALALAAVLLSAASCRSNSDEYLHDLLVDVCMGYDDFRGRPGSLQVVGDPEVKNLHASADAACEQATWMGEWKRDRPNLRSID